MLLFTKNLIVNMAIKIFIGYFSENFTKIIKYLIMVAIKLFSFHLAV